MKRKPGILKRLVLLMILPAAAVIASNIIAVCGIRSVRSDAEQLAGSYAAYASELAEIRGSLANVHRLIFSHIASSNYDVMTSLAAEIKDEEAALLKSVEDCRKYVSEDDKGAYSELVSNYDLFSGKTAEILCASAEGRTEEAYAAASGDAARYAEAAYGCTDRLFGTLKSRGERANKHASAVCTALTVIGTLLTAAGIAAAVSAVRTAANGLAKPVTEAADTLTDSSQDMGAAANEVRRSAQKTSGSAEKLSALAARLSENIGYASESAALVHGNALGIHNSVSEITEQCAAVTEYSSEMTLRAEDMERTAEENMRLIGEKAESISELLGKAIGESKSVESVNRFTQDIVSISSTTNIIAMNAAIEAKRAGEAGKGFSLVAGEIKQLADSCREAASRIEEVNGTVTAAVRDLSEQSGELLDYLNGFILSAFRDTVKNGRQYKDDSAYIEKAMNELNVRAERLKDSAAEITGSVGNIVSALDKSSAAAYETAETGRELAAELANLRGSIDTAVSTAEELRRQTAALPRL